MFSSCTSRLIANVTLGVAAAGTVYYFVYGRKKDKKWVEVGRVEDLMIFPIKAGGGYKVNEADITEYGLQDGNLIDRSFVVVMTSVSPWVHVNQGMAPLLCTIIPTVGLDGNCITFTSLNGSSIDVFPDEAITEKSFDVKGYQCSGYDCGDDVADWLQKELYPPTKSDRAPPTVRLMYVGNPKDLGRPARVPPFFHFPQFRGDDMQIYHDNCAYHLFTSKTFEDFNSKLSKPIPLGQMRPNIVVTGREPYDEDYWAYVKIGNDIILRTLKPRDTCARINVRPDTGEKQSEVLDILKEYRVPAMPEELQERWSKKPLFGLHMALDSGKHIKVGDKVWAVIEKPHWLL